MVVPGRDGRRQHGVEARAVGQPDVGVRRGVVEPPAAGRGEPLGEPTHGRVVAEAHGGQPQPVAVVDPDLVGAVDQHVGDAGLSQQRLERPGAEDVAAERVVHGQHRRVADRSPGRAHRLGHPMRRQVTGRRGQPLAHVVDQARPRSVGHHATSARNSATARPSGRTAMADRSEAEVDGLGEPALLGHLEGHGHPGRRRQVARGHGAAPGRQPQARGVGHRRARSRSVEATPLDRRRRHRPAPGRTAPSARPTRRPPAGRGRGRRASVRAGPPRARRAASTGAASSPTPGAQVSTPTPSRRGTASRSERDPSRPAEAARSSHRTPAVSSRPSSRSSPGPTGSVSTTSDGAGTSPPTCPSAHASVDAPAPPAPPTTPSTSPRPGASSTSANSAPRCDSAAGSSTTRARPQVEGEPEHLRRRRVRDDHDTRPLRWRDRPPPRPAGRRRPPPAAPPTTTPGPRPDRRAPRAGRPPRRRGGPGRRGARDHG